MQALRNAAFLRACSQGTGQVQSRLQSPSPHAACENNHQPLDGLQFYVRHDDSLLALEWSFACTQSQPISSVVEHLLCLEYVQVALKAPGPVEDFDIAPVAGWMSAEKANREGRSLSLALRRASQQHASTSGAHRQSKKFPNGDTYSGGWRNGVPEGEGRYCWADGSTYEGGWRVCHPPSLR